jgi:large subunit ribosomal protein L4
MTKVKVYNQTGKAVGEIKLEPKIFDIEIKPELIQQAVRTQLANKRKVIAHTKDRSEVRGGGRKPWRQKGTGRARHGSIRSPIWKGGGVTFGPRKNRNYSLKMNKKARRKALLMTLSDKARDKSIVVLDKLELTAIKTKDLLKIISKLPLKKKILVVSPKSDLKIIKSARNLQNIKIINANSLNVVDILGYKYLLILKDSLAIIGKTYLK